MEFDANILDICRIATNVYKFTTVEQQRQIIITLGDNQMSVKPDISTGIVIVRVEFDGLECWMECQVISTDTIINYNVG